MNKRDFTSTKIASESLAMTGMLISNLIEKGFAEPSMYLTLITASSLADELGESVTNDDSVVEVISGIAQALRLAAMECAEKINSFIEEHGLDYPTDWQVQLHKDLDKEEN
jgi:hypothetical protein